MKFILDFILLGIILVCVFISAKRGFVKTVVGTVGFILAVTIALSISNPLANSMYDKFVQPSIVKTVETAVGDAFDNNDNDKIIEDLPDFLIDSSERLGFDINEMKQEFTQNATDSVNELAVSISQDIFKPIAVKIMSMIFSLILTIIFLFVIRFVGNIINKLLSFSLIGKVNATLGGILGFIQGILISVVLCLVVSLITTFAGDFLIFTSENINNSILFEFITNTFVIF